MNNIRYKILFKAINKNLDKKFIDLINELEFIILNKKPFYKIFTKKHKPTNSFFVFNAQFNL
jgi:hypothetical protein